MKDFRSRALVDDLRQLPAENSWVEFKENYGDAQAIGTRMAGLSFLRFRRPQPAQSSLTVRRMFGSAVQRRACYQHAVLKFVSGERMRNSTLRERLGVEAKNAAQVSQVIRAALDAKLIRPADPERPQAAYVPHWG